MELTTPALPDLTAGQVTVLTGDHGCGATTLLETAARTRPGAALLGPPPGDDWQDDDVVQPGQGPDHLVGRRMGAMSSGERQRVRLARFLQSSPDAELLLLDEPFAYLDARGVDEALAALRASGTRVLVVCKLDERVHAAADRVLVLADGTLS